jgi:formate-dependent nitrite reductase membrane component NrfD
MVDQFTIRSKPQRWWTSLAAVDFFLGGTGAGAFLVSMYLGIAAGMALGLVAVALGALALLLDLGRPERFWKASSQLGQSWISRGVILTTLFLIFGILRLAPEWLVGLPWGQGTALGQAIAVVATLAALGVMMYTGFLLSHSPSIPFWNTTLLPLLFALYAFTSGVGAIFVLLPVLGEKAVNLKAVEMVGMSLLAASLVFLWVYLLNMSFSTVAAKESVRMLVAGQLAPLFLVGVTLVGLVVPLGLTALIFSANTEFGMASTTLATAGILVLLGGYLFRYAVLRAGVYPPIIDL